MALSVKPAILTITPQGFSGNAGDQETIGINGPLATTIGLVTYMGATPTIATDGKSFDFTVAAGSNYMYITLLSSPGVTDDVMFYPCVYTAGTTAKPYRRQTLSGDGDDSWIPIIIGAPASAAPPAAPAGSNP